MSVKKTPSPSSLPSSPSLPSFRGESNRVIIPGAMCAPVEEGGKADVALVPVLMGRPPVKGRAYWDGG